MASPLPDVRAGYLCCLCPPPPRWTVTGGRRDDPAARDRALRALQGHYMAKHYRREAK